MELLGELQQMSLPTAFQLITALLVGASVVKIYLGYHRLRHVPGPWYAGITPLWLAYRTLKCDVYQAMYDTIQEYGRLSFLADRPQYAKRVQGSMARIAPNIVVTDDPALYRLMTAPRAPFVRGHWFEGMKLDPRIDNIVSMTDEKAHNDLRAKLMPGYTGKDVTTLEVDIDSQIRALLDLIQRHVDGNLKFDFAIFASYYTLDTLTKIAFGHVSGFMANNRDMYDYFKTTSAFFPIMELGMNVPLVQRMLESRLMQALAGPSPSDRVGLGAIVGRAHEEVATRYGPDAKPDQPDMLGSFVRHGLSQVEAESESVVQIMAGSDSTATALRVTFWHIISSPTVYVKLTKEIAGAVDAGRVSFPLITDEEARTLPYLQACIREGLRMFMPLNGLSTRTCPPEGFTFKGIHIPAGTQIGVSIYTMLRRKDVFGSDADTFRPERFLDDDPKSVEEYIRIQEMVFGHGRHGCLGKNIALTELGKVIFELLRNYDFTIVNALQGIETKCSGIVTQKGMFMRAWRKEIC